MFNKKIIKGISIFFVFLCAFGYSINLALRFFKPTYKTETAYNYTVSDVVNSKAVFVRDEKLITSTIPGYYSYLVKDGSAVSKKTAIASVYDKEEYLKIKDNINDLEDELRLLNSVLDKVKLGINNDELTRDINSFSLNIVENVENNNFSNLKEIKNNFQYYMAGKMLNSNEYNSLDNRINTLENNILSQQRLLPWIDNKIYSESDSFFSSYFDGYTELLNTEEIDFFLIYEILDGKTRNVSYKSIIGKEISDFKTFLVIPIEEDDIEIFLNQKSFRIDFGINNFNNISCTLDRVVKNKDNYFAICYTEFLNDFIINTRIADVSIRFKTYNGFKVNKDAVRSYENMEGVFIKTGNLISFKPIEVIYRGDNFVIAEKNDGSNSLRLHDEIIIEGQNLYDGKLIWRNKI